MTIRVFTMLAFACGLALRMAVPGGWMPTVGADGAFILAPCPAVAPVKMSHSGDHHSEHEDHEEEKASGDGDCAFAPLQTSLDVGRGVEAPPSPSVAAQLTTSHRPTAYLPRGPPALPPPATGPPSKA